MRFRIGKVPPGPDFHPERDGWQKSHEPNMLVFWFFAMPTAVVMFIATFIAISEILEKDSTTEYEEPCNDWRPARLADKVAAYG